MLRVRRPGKQVVVGERLRLKPSSFVPDYHLLSIYHSPRLLTLYSVHTTCSMKMATLCHFLTIVKESQTHFVYVPRREERISVSPAFRHQAVARRRQTPPVVQSPFHPAVSIALSPAAFRAHGFS